MGTARLAGVRERAQSAANNARTVHDPFAIQRLVGNAAATVILQRKAAPVLTNPLLAGNAALQAAARDAPRLRQGDRGDGVVALQTALRAVGERLPRSTGPDGTLDGAYGGETKGAVRALQEREGVPYPSGHEAGPKTMRALDGALNRLGPRPPRPSREEQHDGHLGGAVIDIPGLGPVPHSALAATLADPKALAAIDWPAFLRLVLSLGAPTSLVFQGTAELIRWLLERFGKKDQPTPPPEPNPIPPKPSGPDEVRHDLLRRIADRHRVGAAAIAQQHDTTQRLASQRALAEALNPMLDQAMAFPADKRFEHPDEQVRLHVRAAVQLRAAVRAVSRKGDRGAEAEARKAGGLAKGQWCGAFAFAHAAAAGLDSDFAPDTLSTGPNQGLDNLFTYRDSHRWVWTGEEWMATHAYHASRGSLRTFTIVPAQPDPASLDIQPGDIVLKDNAKGTFADHITTCASYDSSTGQLTTVGGNEGANTDNGAGVGVGTFDITKNGAPQTVGPRRSPPASTPSGDGRWWTSRATSSRRRRPSRQSRPRERRVRPPSPTPTRTPVRTPVPNRRPPGSWSRATTSGSTRDWSHRARRSLAWSGSRRRTPTTRPTTRATERRSRTGSCTRTTSNEAVRT